MVFNYVCQPGDKGGGRTILTSTMINQEMPNATNNTDIIIAFDGDERTSNLKIVSAQLLPFVYNYISVI